MKYRILLRENSKRHKGSLFAVFLLMGIVSVVLGTVLSLWINSGSYIRQEMNRLGFGDITVWISGVDSEIKSMSSLKSEIEGLLEISNVGIQNVIYTEYEINAQESDSEGQLIIYSSENNLVENNSLGNYNYHFFTEDLKAYIQEKVVINSGEIYLPTSMISMFDVKVGDEFNIKIARNNTGKTFIVKGFFEDPFMGSSMIGMKSFLISNADYEEIARISTETGIDTLVKIGGILHIFAADGEDISASELNRLLNKSTSLEQYTEFVYSFEAIYGFMLILQNAFLAFLIAFVLILLFITVIVLGHSIDSTIEQDTKNIGILKTIGFTGKMLGGLQIVQYLIPILSSMIMGLLLSMLSIKIVCNMMLTTTGVLVIDNIQLGICVIVFLLILCLLIGFLIWKISKINKISAMESIREDIPQTAIGQKTPFSRKGLIFWIAVRQLFTGKKRYISACIIAILLVFFASLMGRLNNWLGANGEGMMDAFNPADHHLGVQSLSEISREDIENIIRQYTNITDYYELAMPDISLNGVNYTANVISEPSRFHIMEGKTCVFADEIVITEYMAADWGLQIGDRVTVSTRMGSDEYIVSGIYQCANDMGQNIGMSRDGYLKIGQDSESLWCIHYFFENEAVKSTIMKELETQFGTAIHVHENSWPGLYGVLSAMQIVLILMYIIVAIFILIVVLLTGSKIMYAERKDMEIYKEIGFREINLRVMFTIKFGITAIIGSSIGIVLAGTLTNPLVSLVMKQFGISNFRSNPETISIMLPAIIVIVWFVIASYLSTFCHMFSLDN